MPALTDSCLLRPVEPAADPFGDPTIVPPERLTRLRLLVSLLAVAVCFSCSHPESDPADPPPASSNGRVAAPEPGARERSPSDAVPAAGIGELALQAAVRVTGQSHTTPVCLDEMDGAEEWLRRIVIPADAVPSDCRGARHLGVGLSESLS
jgi:hypothetical protein